MASIAEQVETYIDYKHGLGASFRSSATSLRQFARFADSAGHDGPVDVDIACRWARSGTGHTRGYECSRYEQARRLSDFCRVFDESLPHLPAGLLGRANNRVEPYIYSHEDICLLMRAAGSLDPACPLRPLSHRFLIGLLRATGMRPSEAVGLDDDDIDDDNRAILVRDSKGKSRLLPVSDTTFEAIMDYRQRRDRIRPHHECAKLIISTRGEALTLGCAEDAFQEYRHVLLGRGQVWDRRPPRLYDIRHSFCCWTIIDWHQAGRDVVALMPSLSTYMGHDSIANTYWYLSNVPTLMSIACEAFRGMAAMEVFPDE